MSIVTIGSFVDQFFLYAENNQCGIFPLKRSIKPAFAVLYAGDTPSADVRLVSSSDEVDLVEGRVQVRHNDTWKAICDDQWGLIDSQVICRMLCFQ